MRKIQTVPQQLSSRLEDLKKDLKARKYKDSYILPAFEKALKITRDKALEKVLKVDNKKRELIFQSHLIQDFLTTGLSSNNTGLI